MIELEEANSGSGKGKLGYMPFECGYLATRLKARKEKAAEVLKKNKKGLTDAKNQARSHSHSKSSDPADIKADIKADTKRYQSSCQKILKPRSKLLSKLLPKTQSDIEAAIEAHNVRMQIDLIEQTET